MHIKYNIVNENNPFSSNPMISAADFRPFGRKKSEKKPVFVRNFFPHFVVDLSRYVFSSNDK